MNKQFLHFIYVLLIFLTLPLAATAQVVDILDPNLRAAVEKALGKASGATITTADMAKLTHLEARNANISDLTGLEFATNLQSLDLGYGEGGTSHAVKDLSPLADLTQLTYLHLPGKSISDISAVAGLTNLTWLNLWGNPISDISPVAGLINLTDLYLGNNTISDISPLVANTGLGSGDRVFVNDNPLSFVSIKTHVPALQSRGVTVEFDDTTHLNIGDPRTVRLIYFLPNDRPYRVALVQQMKDEILKVQTFFAEQMGLHGYGNKTFRVETDSQGEPMVHHVAGQYPDNHYVNKDLGERYLDLVKPMVLDEIAQTFNTRANIYIIFIDTDIGEGQGGAGQRLGNGGEALILSPIYGESILRLVAHELGHAFGLLHDFRDGSFLMSYGSYGRPASRDRLAVCHADFLDAHPYFIPIPQLRTYPLPPSNSFRRAPIRQTQKAFQFDSKLATQKGFTKRSYTLHHTMDLPSFQMTVVRHVLD